ncbi:hypothetical protein ACVIGB_000391 [Bradyrhizobium sp. USDA 4341]
MTADRLRELLIRIDCTLTGRPVSDAAHMAHNQASFFEDLTKFVTSREYYLSDGGYSRLLFDEIEEKFRLSSNSRDQIKAVWKSGAVEDLVAEAAQILMTRLKDDVKDNNHHP